MKRSLQSILRVCAAVVICTVSILSASALNKNQKVAPRQSSGEEVIFSEDFSGCTAALSDSVSLRNSSTFLLDPEMLGEEGWWGNYAYCSEGAVALAYPNYGGMINTPGMNMYGKITVSFRYRVRPGNKVLRNFWVHVLYGNPAVSEPVVDLNTSSLKVICDPNDTEWKDFSFTFDNPYNGNDAFVEINAQFALPTGLEIDDLKVTRVSDFVTAPTSLRVKEVTDNSFTVGWIPGAENMNYLVNCIEQKILSEELQDYSEDFSGESMPENWTGEGVLAKGEGFELKDAVELTLNQTLYGPVNYSTVKSLKFSIRPEELTDMRGMSVVKIMGLTEAGKWETPSEIMLLLVPVDGMVIDLAEQAPNFLDKYIGFGLKFANYLDEESGKVFISDVHWTTDGSQERATLLENEIVSEPEITVEDIDPDARHFIEVTGVNGELKAKAPRIEVIGVAAPNEVKAINESEENISYTANWEQVRRADAGYVIRNYIVTKATEPIADYTVMKDYFTTGIPGVKYVEDRTLDAYTDVPGWTVESKPETTGYAKIGGGQLGGDGRAIIVSPEMSLTNNNGEFTLDFTLAGHGNVMLDITAGDETQSILLPGEYDWENNAEAYAEKKFSLTFHSGDAATRLRFTSPNWHAFMLSGLTIKQNVAKDEYIYRLDRKINAEAGVTSLDIDNKALGRHLYAFGVQSLMSNGEAVPYESKVVLSPIVDFETVAVDEIAEDSISAGTADGTIWINLSQNADIEIFSTSGALISRISGIAGRNVIDSLTPGIYIVRSLGKTCKVVL